MKLMVNAEEFNFYVHFCVTPFKTHQSLHFGLLSWSRHSHLEKRWLGWTGGCKRMGQLGRCDLFQCQREMTEPCQTEMEFAEEQSIK